MKTVGDYSLAGEKLLKAIERRVQSHQNSERNSEFTIKQMLSDWNARLLRPQRLVSLTFDEEERRALRGWWCVDFKLCLATMVELEELSHLVSDPEMFRENVRDLVVFMSDQIPMWLKIKPGNRYTMSGRRDQANKCVS